MKNNSQKVDNILATQKGDLPAGRFSTWLRLTRSTQATKAGTLVPCGDCTACCHSSYFIHIEPDEAETLTRIPKELLFAAPGLPKGHVLLGYDEHGRCPMFIDNKCSIYEQRPRTCRQYDCRVFPATGLSVGEEKPLIARQAQRWQFTVNTAWEYKHLAVLHAAAKFLQKYAHHFPVGFVPTNTPQQAMLAIKVYEVFRDYTDELDNIESEKRICQIVTAVMTAYEEQVKIQKA